MSFVTDSILKTALGKIKAWGEGKFVAQESGKGLSTNDYTTAEKTKLSGIAEGANKYVHPSYTAQKSGLYKVTVDAAGHVSGATAVAKADITGLGIPAQDTTYSNMTAATASAAGKAGLVPAPAAGKQASFLRGDGTWVVPENTIYADATTSTHGLMSVNDKKKLDAIASGAQVNKIETVKVNGTALTPDSSKAVNVDLSAYAKSADVTKEIASAVSGVTQIDYSVVEALPSTGKKGVIYLVANSGSGNNIYDEYIYINSKFEKLGSREMDLSSYAKKTDIPTKVSSLTNDSGYQTAAQVTSAINAKLVVMTDTELNAMWTEVFGA
ncbi:hypothetical protein [Faecalibacillus intestinalis]|uniref:hypothetical protein n=1 Tax=Faecalibacillus intestinalis TaxID=1982626 RepID=UPI003AB3CD95